MDQITKLRIKEKKVKYNYSIAVESPRDSIQCECY